MKGRLSGIAAIIAIMFWAPVAQGQEMTEQFIPVGKSPGISGVYSYIGEIEALDLENRVVTVAGPEGALSVKVTDETRIWLDRSEQQLTTTVGAIEDLQPGRRIEVKFVDYETKESADWIKVVPGTG